METSPTGPVSDSGAQGFHNTPLYLDISLPDLAPGSFCPRRPKRGPKPGNEDQRPSPKPRAGSRLHFHQNEWYLTGRQREVDFKFSIKMIRDLTSRHFYEKITRVTMQDTTPTPPTLLTEALETSTAVTAARGACFAELTVPRGWQTLVRRPGQWPVCHKALKLTMIFNIIFHTCLRKRMWSTPRGLQSRPGSERKSLGRALSQSPGGRGAGWSIRLSVLDSWLRS